MKALVLVDIQNDFMPGGALPVPGGDAVVPIANRMAARAPLVVATQDWHPPDHGSFASNHPGRKPYDVTELNGLEQILWPDHCVQDTRGAAFVKGLETSAIERVFRKGTDPRIDSYSGFFDNGHRKATGLGDFLRDRGIDEVYVAGVATDYCVKFTALDARELGLRTVLVEDGCRGVDVNEGDVSRAIAEMRRAGVTLMRSTDLSAA